MRGRQPPPDDLASMGPRLFRRGNAFSVPPAPPPSLCFNGATSFQTWKYPFRHQYPPLPPCFNGATSFQTWKWVTSWAKDFFSVSLQWGHVFSDVEMAFSIDGERWHCLLQWGHVFSDVEITFSLNI